MHLEYQGKYKYNAIKNTNLEYNENSNTIIANISVTQTAMHCKYQNLKYTLILKLWNDSEMNETAEPLSIIMITKCGPKVDVMFY